MTYNPTNPNGQATSANSSPVVIANDQSAVKVDGSAVTQPVSAATLPLPTGAATSAKQSDGSQKTQVVDGSGNVISSTSNALDVNVKYAGGMASNFGSTTPTAGTAAGYSDGTNMQMARTYDSDTGAGTENTLGVVLRKSASGGSVEAGTNTNPLRVDPTGTTTQPISGTITANIGTTNGVALDASVTGLQVSQGSTTSGQKGGLAMGAVTTSAPSYTTGQTSPLSLDASGNLRVVTAGGSNSVSINDGATTANNVAGDTGQNAVLTAGARKEVSFSFSGAGNGTAVDVSNYRWLSVHVTANAGTINFEASNDNTNFVAVALMNAQTTAGSAGTNTNSSSAIFHGPLSYRYFRLRQSSSTSSGIMEFFANPAAMQTMGITGGTVSATQSGSWTVQPGNTANTTAWNMNLAPSTTGGWSVSSQTNLTTTATVSAAAGKFAGYMFLNLNSTPAYVQVFDTTGAVTLGTTTPTFVVPIPANSTAANGAGANLELTNGIAITSGIKVAATTTPTGATTVSTGLTGFILYK